MAKNNTQFIFLDLFLLVVSTSHNFLTAHGKIDLIQKICKGIFGKIRIEKMKSKENSGTKVLKKMRIPTTLYRFVLGMFYLHNHNILLDSHYDPTILNFGVS